MSDSYLPDNAPRDILLSLEELAARKLPHAPTFRKAATEIERLRQLLSDTNTYYAECIAEREDLRAENEKLREAWKEICVCLGDYKNDAFRDCVMAFEELTANNKKMRTALVDTLKNLIASVSLLESGGKEAASSDRMFEQMLIDYKNSIERGRAAAAAIRESGE